jgi:hypothetical protein
MHSRTVRARQPAQPRKARTPPIRQLIRLRNRAPTSKWRATASWRHCASPTACSSTDCGPAGQLETGCWKADATLLEALTTNISANPAPRGLAPEPDFTQPGVFFKGRKPEGWTSRPLDDVDLYSIILDRRARTIGRAEVLWFRAVYRLRSVARRVLPPVVRRAIRRVLRGLRGPAARTGRG